jgi:hypothetical protein
MYHLFQIRREAKNIRRTFRRVQKLQFTNQRVEIDENAP